MEDLDLRKILTVGDKVYSPLFGDCKVTRIADFEFNSIEVRKKDGNIQLFHSDGKFFKVPDTECLLFPSKKVRTWEGYKPHIPDKALVWAWENNDNFERILTFYDAKNRCTFLPASGQREGCRFDNYELYEGEEPEWATEARKNLED